MREARGGMGGLCDQLAVTCVLLGMHPTSMCPLTRTGRREPTVPTYMSGRKE